MTAYIIFYNGESDYLHMWLSQHTLGVIHLDTIWICQTHKERDLFTKELYTVIPPFKAGELLIIIESFKPLSETLQIFADDIGIENIKLKFNSASKQIQKLIFNTQKEYTLDQLLEKINISGIESLSEWELYLLEQYSKNI